MRWPHYVRVVEAGSLSAAATQLRISPAAVSRQIATLERELRVPLLRRTTRRMSVTPAGRSYYERALRVLREVDDAQAIGRTAATAGLLSASAPVTFGLACVVPQLSSFMTAHPGLRVDLRLEDRPIDLALEGVDLAVRVGGAPPDSTDVIAHELMSFRRVLVAAPSYLKSHGAPGTPEALAKHDALAGAVDSWTRATSRASAEAFRGRRRLRHPCQLWWPADVPTKKEASPPARSQPRGPSAMRSARPFKLSSQARFARSSARCIRPRSSCTGHPSNDSSTRTDTRSPCCIIVQTCAAWMPKELPVQAMRIGGSTSRSEEHTS